MYSLIIKSLDLITRDRILVPLSSMNVWAKWLLPTSLSPFWQAGFGNRSDDKVGKYFAVSTKFLLECGFAFKLELYSANYYSYNSWLNNFASMTTAVHFFWRSSHFKFSPQEEGTQRSQRI